MSENEAKTAKHEHNVIIIGAGMAGLSAANHLLKNGLTDFRILEARNRTGGRIVSIDLGAEKVRTRPSLTVTHRIRYIMICY